MRLLIVSDIHGSFNNMKEVIVNEKFDKLILLGDILSGYGTDGYNPNQLALLLNLYKDKIICVKGNCDRYDLDLLEFSVDKIFDTLEVDGKTIFITHGNYYNSSNLPDIDFDIFIQGHTHVDRMEKVNNKIYLNPGSISLPRGGDGKTYIVYENGVFTIKDIDGKSVNSISVYN